MALPADYHMHTPLCRHAVGEPTEYAAQAVKLGLTEIGMSDHNPMVRDDYDDWHMRQAELDEYVEKVRQAQRDHPRLAIKLALETDYLPSHVEWIRELAARHQWDYLIGSVHYVTDTWDLDNPKRMDEWRKSNVFEVWSAYFERLTMAAESGLFEIIGHADLCKKFRFYPEQDCSPLYERFLQAAAKHGVAIEINTAGLRKDCKEMYPHRDILKRARQLGVGLTFGSDAHMPEEVAMDFAGAIALAKDVGYTHWCRFRHRQRELVPL
jgi:histidinol-phosphatase (PHP family)